MDGSGAITQKLPEFERVMEINFSFIGDFCHTIDEKGRLALPGKLRDELGHSERPDEVVAYADPNEGYLAFYPHEQWRKIEEAAIGISDNKSRKAITRRLGFNSERLGIDKSGRVLISQKHRAIAGLDKEVMVIGGVTKIELWEKNRFEEKTLAEDALVFDALSLEEVPL